MTPPVKSGPRFDNMIQSDKVRVIDQDGENLGVMLTAEAIEQANGLGLNLVEVSPNADPPVAKYLDVGKYRYEAQKKANAARKTQKTQEIKEIKMRPNIDTHDYDVKMRSVFKFLEEGDKVKMTLRFHSIAWLAVSLRSCPFGFTTLSSAHSVLFRSRSSRSMNRRCVGNFPSAGRTRRISMSFLNIPSMSTPG
jgi:translation initiation factor IF-3